MAERTSITQIVQIGVEATPGTAVAATKRLQSVGFELSPDGDINTFRAAGSKFPAIASVGKEFAGGDLSGQPTYTELVYPLSALLGEATITTPGGGTLSRDWDWDIKSSAEQEGKSLTIERGSAVRAERVAGAVVPEFGIEYSRDELSLTGALLAKAFEDGITLTDLSASPTALLDLIPILPKEVDVYLDTTFGGLGSTKLLRALNASWSIGDRFGALWPLNSTLPSYATTFETEPSSEVTLTLEADAAGMALLPVMRAGTTRFLRIEATGPIIEAAIPYKLTVDLACKVTEVPEYSDEDGIWAVGWNMGLFADPDWGKAGHIKLTTDLTAL